MELELELGLAFGAREGPRVTDGNLQQARLQKCEVEPWRQQQQQQ